VHAYGNGLPGEVRVTAGVRDRHIWVSVEDDGCGHLTPSTRSGLGQGLRLIQ
jgi:anti-sigma regulatory factor (Ser/Thr protein kinase)